MRNVSCNIPGRLTSLANKIHFIITSIIFFLSPRFLLHLNINNYELLAIIRLDGLMDLIKTAGENTVISQALILKLLPVSS